MGVIRHLQKFDLGGGFYLFARLGVDVSTAGLLIDHLAGILVDAAAPLTLRHTNILFSSGQKGGCSAHLPAILVHIALICLP